GRACPRPPAAAARPARRARAAAPARRAQLRAAHRHAAARADTLARSMEDPPMNRPWPNEFHVSRAVRDRCRFDEELFAASGHAVLARPTAAHRFAAALEAAGVRAQREAGGSVPASPADLFAMGLLDEAAHLVIAHWRVRHDPNGFRDALEHLERALGERALDRLLLEFARAFPTTSVYRGR